MCQGACRKADGHLMRVFSPSPTWVAGGQTWTTCETLLSFTDVGSRGQTRIVRLDSKFFLQLNHLTCPNKYFKSMLLVHICGLNDL